MKAQGKTKKEKVEEMEKKKKKIERKKKKMGRGRVGGERRSWPSR